MSSVPRSASPGQTPALDFTNPRAMFVWLTEAREAFAVLDAIAVDATRPPARRKLTRVAARQRLAEARAAVAWLVTAAPLLGPTTAPTCAGNAGSRFEPWAE